MSVQEFDIEIVPSLPEKLRRLEELANDLWYSWDPLTRMLFENLDKSLWIRTGHNPKLFLRNISQRQLDEAASNSEYLKKYERVLVRYDAYCSDQQRRDGGKKFEANDLIVYFCAEYGFHESLPTYSGGLGILAGDHCKAASDLRLPFIAVGLYYHRGYFAQLVDASGNQIVTGSVSDPNHLPIEPVVDELGEEIQVSIKMSGRNVLIKVWKVQIGHISLYLLDTKVSQNSAEDAEITHQLYGGGQDTRIKQEIILGIGGVRMLRKLKLLPTVWHINEGHAAFLLLERLREHREKNEPLNQAIEAVASNTIFTTHTPVPAGHDKFPHDLLMDHLGAFPEKLGISVEEFLALGKATHGDHDFNMTSLAINVTRHMNGVSRIHGDVSSEICSPFWPQIEPHENPMSYVTNGVHVPTFLALEWNDVFDEYLGKEWRHSQCDPEFWLGVKKIPDDVFWQTKQTIKKRMLRVVRNTLVDQHLRNQVSEAHIERMLKLINPENPNILTIGFARRFATYKRGTLLFKDTNWLSSIINKTGQPVVFLFAGKAHPADEPGQALLREIHEIGNRPEFVGKVLVVQGYDLGLSRRLVSGVDVWLNNPIYPLEASGTSGMKAAVNACINLSVLDGWWAESYDSDNGWGIKPSPNENPEWRDNEDARTLYELLQDEVVPLYYKGLAEQGFSSGWVKTAKHSMMTVLPNFNMNRMVNEYVDNFYLPAARQGRKLRSDEYAKAGILANWKTKVDSAWREVQVRSFITPPAQLQYGQPVAMQVAVQLGGLEPQDVTVELLLSRKVYHPAIYAQWSQDEMDVERLSYKFKPEYALQDTGEYLYAINFNPDWCGGLSYKVRIYPHHESLAHDFEMGMIKWL